MAGHEASAPALQWNPCVVGGRGAVPPLMLPELYAHLNPVPFEAAVQMELDLREAGYTVNLVFTGRKPGRTWPRCSTGGQTHLAPLLQMCGGLTRNESRPPRRPLPVVGCAKDSLAC